jgi:peptidoglycan/xylan/chitin deacetylase (PgdA/CDA1 family)
MKLRRRKLLDFLLQLLHNAGFFSVMRLFNRDKLTVLNYHRVDDPARHSFEAFRPNFSATPAQFARQMDYVKRHYSAITCERLVGWLHGMTELPANPLLITFDDGYLDNLTYAYPVLKERKLPAVIFLTTDHIGKNIPFYWDYVAYVFAHTQKTSMELPLIGKSSWSTVFEREKVMGSWLEELKRISNKDRLRHLAKIAEILDVPVPPDVFSGSHLNWDHIRAMSPDIEFGAHTASHPILTRISTSEAAYEVETSLRRIEDEIGVRVSTFAYPNGHESDYSPEVIEMLKKSGVKIAFTLLPGLNRLDTIRKKPHEIHRIFLLHTDSFSRFVAKISGLDRWVN